MNNILLILSITSISVLGAVIPGPDFALVSTNSISHNRTIGYYTAFGIGSAVLIHLSYCLFGIVIVMKHSHWILNMLQYIGGTYIIYLGINTIRKLNNNDNSIIPSAGKTSTSISYSQAYSQGFLCNLLNPKCSLFYISLFTTIDTNQLTLATSVSIAISIALSTCLWFCFLSWLINLPQCSKFLTQYIKYITYCIGAALIGFGIFLYFI